jgi:dTDP-4-dehydrorhamnose reductase
LKARNILITGGSGYLGLHLCAKAAKIHTVFTTYRIHPNEIKAGEPIQLDLTSRGAVLKVVRDLAPQAIIHTAAVNPGQGDEQVMRQVNVQGSRYVAEAAAAVGARLVHVSTDVVHDGRHAPYADDAPPSPLNAYGRSKAAAETAVAEIDPQAAIVRTSLIYGLDEMDRGTAGFIERLKKGEPLVLFNDVVRQPVWVENLSEALLKLTHVEFGGLLNVAGRQALTREKFGRRLLAWWHVDPGDLLSSGRAADISDTIPLDLRMSVSKAEQLLQMDLPGVDEVLELQRNRTHLRKQDDT